MTTLTSPHDLLAAVPFLIGYHPENSLVLVAIRNGLIGVAMRVDHQECYEPDYRDMLVGHLIREGADSALLVAYLPDGSQSDGSFIYDFRQSLANSSIVLQEALLVCDGRWRSTLCLDLSCCPLEGNLLPKLSDSIVTAEQVFAGKALPFADSAELLTSLHSSSKDKKILEALENLEGRSTIYLEPSDIQRFQQEGALAIDQLHAEFAEKGHSDQKELVALVLFNLLDLHVRDYALGIATSENSKTLLDLWRWLTGIAPAGYAAPPATLYAELLYESGAGALAIKALERAFEDCPDYQLAKLLRRTFAAGWPPSQFEAMRSQLHPKICEAIFGGLPEE